MQEDGGLIVRKWSAMPLRARSDGVWRGALRRRARATDAPAKVQRCTRQLQSFALPHGATFALLPSATFALPRVPPLRFPLFCLCAIASASMQVGDATGACLMRHTALPRNGGAMQNAAGNPIRKKVPAFSVLPKIYFPPILLALTDISDNLSRIFARGDEAAKKEVAQSVALGLAVRARSPAATPSGRAACAFSGARR